PRPRSEPLQPATLNRKPHQPIPPLCNGSVILLPAPRADAQFVEYQGNFRLACPGTLSEAAAAHGNSAVFSNACRASGSPGLRRDPAIPGRLASLLCSAA